VMGKRRRGRKILRTSFASELGFIPLLDLLL